MPAALFWCLDGVWVVLLARLDPSVPPIRARSFRDASVVELLRCRGVNRSNGPRSRWLPFTPGPQLLFVLLVNRFLHRCATSQDRSESVHCIDKM